MGPLTVQPAEGDLASACACCAGEAGLRGFVYENDDARAVYFVEPLGVPNYPLIKLGIVVGEWGSGSPTSSRLALALLCKPAAHGPDLAPAEPKMLAFPEFSMLGRRVDAAELARHPALASFHEIAKAVIDQDWRLDAIRGSDADQAPRRRFSAEPT